MGLGVTLGYELTGPGIPIHRFRARFTNHDGSFTRVDEMGNGTFGMIFALLTPLNMPTYIALVYWASGPPGSRAAANRSGTYPASLKHNM